MTKHEPTPEEIRRRADQSSKSKQRRKRKQQQRYERVVGRSRVLLHAECRRFFMMAYETHASLRKRLDQEPVT